MTHNPQRRRQIAAGLRSGAVAVALIATGCQSPQGGGSQRAQPRPAKKAASVLVFGLDMSDSTGQRQAKRQELIARRCDEVQEALRKRVFETPNQPLRVQILQTGLAEHAILTVVPWTDVGGRTGAPRLEMPAAANQRLERQVQDVAALCRTAAQSSDSSPIYALAEAAAQSADAECRSTCERTEVRMHTDGSEGGPLGQRWLKAALDGSAVKQRGAASPVPAERVLKTAAKVVICGFSEAVAPVRNSKGGKGYAHLPLTLGERQAIWRAVVSAQDLRFEPACGRAPGQQGLATAGNP
jgi:hypothetical protein